MSGKCPPGAPQRAERLDVRYAHLHSQGCERRHRLEVGERTVRRYAGHLLDLGMPVVRRLPDAAADVHRR